MCILIKFWLELSANFPSSLLAGGAGFLSLQERQWESCKVNLHDQSCSGFIYCFPCYRRFIHQDSPGSGFWRAEGFWLLLTSWALLGVSDEDRDEEPGLGMGFMCCSCLPVPEQEPGMGPFGKGARCAGLGWTWVKTELCWAGQGRTWVKIKLCWAGQGWPQL